jgi:bifunctional non-homologous end joining protein LigD
VEYPIIDDPSGLVYMANQGSLELHVGTSRSAALDQPDTLVFDLDPPEGRFDLARRAAHAVHALFDQLGLPAFVKLTGKKGLHVVAPLDGTAPYAAVHALATRIGALLCRRHPDLLTMELYKADRAGRLFLDILRNAPGATVVAPYSLRGRPAAPVAAPITWAELHEPGLTAGQIGLRDLRAQLSRRGDPWGALRARPAAAAAVAAALDAGDA